MCCRGSPFTRFHCSDTHGSLARAAVRAAFCSSLRRGDVVQLVRTLPCHGRGRGFESRRPRHSFQKSCTDFDDTNGGAKGHVSAPFLHPFSSIKAIFTFALCRTWLRHAGAVEFVPEVNTRASTAAWAACFAGVIAWVYASRVDRSVECRSSSCITLNSVPTLRSRVE